MTKCRARRTRADEEEELEFIVLFFIVVWRFLGFCAAFREDGVEAL